MKFLSSLVLSGALMAAPLTSFAALVKPMTAQAGAGTIAPLMLAQNGKTDYVITLAADAIPAENTAAQQLQKYLRQVTGAEFPIRAEKEVALDKPQVLVGAGPRVKALLPRQNWGALGQDGIVLRTSGNKLVLAGGRNRGSLYAVYEFLEKSAGCRWWAPGAQTIPSKKVLRVAPQNTTYVPPFRYREHFTTDVQNDPEFATIMRNNGHHQTQSPEWGGHYNMLGWCHTFCALLPVETNFKDHPEWYSDPANGNKPCTSKSAQPVYHATQPDLTNPQVLDEITKAALKWIDQNPNAGYISISQNDGGAFCMTPEAQAIIEREGSASGLLIQFVNKVAARIHEKYPGFLVETLAYGSSTQPPKTVRPAANVIVRFAPITSDFGHPIESEQNKGTRELLEAWQKISPQLFVWNYASNFTTTINPHPNWDGLAKDLRYFAAHKVTGIFEQGDAYTNGIGDFVQLRAWLMGRLMWNPNQDQDKLITEFTDGYYGAAAPYLRGYLYAVLKAYRATNRGLSTYNTDLTFFDLNLTNESIRLFDKAALAVKGDSILEERVTRSRLSFDSVLLRRYKFLKRTADARGIAFLGPQEPEVALKAFMETVRKFGVPSMGVAAIDEDFEKAKKILYMPLPTAPLPDFAKAYPADDVIDLQEKDYYLYSQGSLTDAIDDPKASDGRAAWVVGSSQDWAIQIGLGAVLDGPGQWRMYGLMRADTEPGAKLEGPAFVSGAYDQNANESFGLTEIPAKDLASPDYQRIDFGVKKLNSGMYLWVCPRNNPAVKKIYIDRLILIREGGEKAKAAP